MLEKFDTTCTTASTLGNANWNGEIPDIKGTLRKVQEQIAKNVGRDAGKIPNRIVFTPEAFQEIESHLFRPGMIDEPLETINGIPFDVIAGDTPAMLHALAKSCLGEAVMLVTKGEVGLCVRNYSDQFSPEKMGRGIVPEFRRAYLTGDWDPESERIPHFPFPDPKQPIRFNPRW